MSRNAVLTPWVQLREQWQESLLVRLGALLAAALLSVYLLLAGFDEVDVLLERNRGLAAELTRLQGLAKETDWPERRREVSGLKVAYDTAIWMDPDLALSEADLQDWLRNVTQRLGLKVREISLLRAEPSARPAGTVPAGYVEVRAHLSVELQRTQLFVLLAEMASQERRIVVERLTMRGQSQPATADLDLRILARPGSKP